MKKFFMAIAISMASFIAAETATAVSILNFGGMRTTVYSFSKKNFDGAESETRSMQRISGIINNGPLNVVFVESSKNEVVIQGDKNLFCRVQTQCKDGIVNISLEPGTYRNLWLQVVVYAEKLDCIKCTGSGNFKAEKVFSTAEEMSVKVTGSAYMEIGQIKCERNLDFHISGSGDIQAGNVSCMDLEADVSGSGDIKVENAQYNKLDADVRGSGGIKIGKSEGLDADLMVAGSGTIKLLEGHVKYIKARVTGSGDIIGSVTCDGLEQKVSGSGSIRLK